jgi:hypothetical protein
VVGRLFMNCACLERILVLALLSSPAISQEIDRQFTYSAELTGDGRSESVVLAIRGAAIDKPFQWSLTVTDRENHILFKVEKDDSRFDKATWMAAPVTSNASGTTTSRKSRRSFPIV